MIANCIVEHLCLNVKIKKHWPASCKRAVCRAETSVASRGLLLVFRDVVEHQKRKPDQREHHDATTGDDCVDPRRPAHLRIVLHVQFRQRNEAARQREAQEEPAGCVERAQRSSRDPAKKPEQTHELQQAERGNAPRQGAEHGRLTPDTQWQRDRHGHHHPPQPAHEVLPPPLQHESDQPSDHDHARQKINVCFHVPLR